MHDAEEVRAADGPHRTLRGVLVRARRLFTAATSPDLARGGEQRVTALTRVLNSYARGKSLLKLPVALRRGLQLPEFCKGRGPGLPQPRQLVVGLAFFVFLGFGLRGFGTEAAAPIAEQQV